MIFGVGGGGDVLAASLGVGWFSLRLWETFLRTGWSLVCWKVLCFGWLVDGRKNRRGKHVPLPLSIREVLQLSEYLLLIRWPNKQLILKKSAFRR